MGLVEVTMWKECFWRQSEFIKEPKVRGSSCKIFVCSVCLPYYFDKDLICSGRPLYPYAIDSMPSWRIIVPMHSCQPFRRTDAEYPRREVYPEKGRVPRKGRKDAKGDALDASHSAGSVVTDRCAA